MSSVYYLMYLHFFPLPLFVMFSGFNLDLIRSSSNFLPKSIPSVITIDIPFRSIPCKSLTDDFYSSLIDWTGYKIFYCENNAIFQYNFYTSVCTKIFDDQTIVVCSIKCISQANILAIGCSSGLMVCLDLASLKITKYLLHRGRISALEIVDNRILTGSRDRKVKMIDLRTGTPERIYSFHMQEVCGIAVNRDMRYMCTGGNDNKIIVMDLRKDNTYYKKLEEHKAAVKALSWSPLCSTKFISGGGTADKTLKQWDVSIEQSLERSISFESQVCNLRWLDNGKILSTFGYSNDDIKLLNNFEVEKMYSGHRNRVIHFAVDGKEEYFASGSGDSDINIWQIEKGEREFSIR